MSICPIEICNKLGMDLNVIKTICVKTKIPISEGTAIRKTQQQINFFIKDKEAFISQQPNNETMSTKKCRKK